MCGKPNPVFCMMSSGSTTLCKDGAVGFVFVSITYMRPDLHVNRTNNKFTQTIDSELAVFEIVNFPVMGTSLNAYFGHHNHVVLHCATRL